jgi:hypothetical protein
VVDLLAGVAPPLALMPMTTSEAGAQTWLTDHGLAGIEGVVPSTSATPMDRRDGGLSFGLFV